MRRACVQYLTVKGLASGWVEMYAREVPAELAVALYGAQPPRHSISYGETMGSGRFFEGVNNKGYTCFGS